MRASLTAYSLEYYGPQYKLEVLSNNMDDYNSKEYLNGIKWVPLPCWKSRTDDPSERES